MSTEPCAVMQYTHNIVFFFFRRRRRHTRLQVDWSSDVCSSDLDIAQIYCIHHTSDDQRDVVLSERQGGISPFLGALHDRTVNNTTRTVVPCSAKVPSGSSSQVSASGRSSACWRGPFAHRATRTPPGRRNLRA